MIYIEPILIISQIYTIKHLLTPRPWGLRWSFPGSPAEAPGRIWQGCSLVRPRSQVRLSKTYVLLKEHWIISKKLGYCGTRAQDGWLQPLLLFFFVGNDQLCGSIASIKPKLIKPDYESPRPDPQKKCSNLPNRSSPSKERVSKQPLIRKKSSFFRQIPREIPPWFPHEIPIISRFHEIPWISPPRWSPQGSAPAAPGRSQESEGPVVEPSLAIWAIPVGQGMREMEIVSQFGLYW